MLYKAINKFKIIIFPVIIILSLFFGVASAYAEESGTGESDILDKVISNAEEAGNATTDGYDNDGSAFDVISNFSYGIHDACNLGWKFVKLMLKGDSAYGLKYTDGGQDINSIVTTVVNILKPFAFAFAYLAWLVNVMSSAAKYELMTAKRGFQLLAGLVLIGLWINLSLNICSAIVNINSDMVRVILDQTSEELAYGSWYKNGGEKSSLWIIGWIVDFVSAIANSEFIFYIIISLAMTVVAIIVSIKLAMRYLKISCLACVSPLFFGFVVGEETRPYFKNFISEFINTVMETLYMAIVYVIGLNWYNHTSAAEGEIITNLVEGNSTFGSSSQIPNMLFMAIVVIAIGVMMIKPPRILTDLIRR